MWWAIVLGGGSGKRMQSERNKVLLHLGGESILIRSVRILANHVQGIVVVIRQEDHAEASACLDKLSLGIPCLLTDGGLTRQDSVRCGMQLLPPECTSVLIHDGARCLVDGQTIRNVQASVDVYGTGIASTPVDDTIKVVDADSMVLSTPNRNMLRAVQTPQGFRLDLLVQAHRKAMEDGFVGTDDASLVERMGVPVHLSEGNRTNMKITHPEDMERARFLLDREIRPQFRIGHGYDVHRLVEDRPLILCGVRIPCQLGLLGHSDADVAVHALMDALLGACALGDIGHLFPDNDPAYAGADSMMLLDRVIRLIRTEGWTPANTDLTLIAQKPRLAPFISSMRENLASVMGIPVSCVSVKATTTEHLGFEGRGEGISAHAVVLCQSISGH